MLPKLPMVVIIDEHTWNLTNFYTQKYKGMSSGVAEGHGTG
jgi:hypothetical protein